MKTLLTKKEELIMLSILQLKEKAYLVSILEHLNDTTSRNFLLTAIHVPLTRLEKKGFIESAFGESTATRGGRRKKIYRLTKEGITVMREHKTLNDTMWSDLTEILSVE